MTAELYRFPDTAEVFRRRLIEAHRILLAKFDSVIADASRQRLDVLRQMAELLEEDDE
jgi:hypothetical protein